MRSKSRCSGYTPLQNSTKLTNITELSLPSRRPAPGLDSWRDAACLVLRGAYIRLSMPLPLDFGGTSRDTILRS